MKEIWNDKKDYEGHYQVSNCGRVKSIKFGKEIIMKQQQCMDGYYYVNLSKNGIAKRYSVHRLVAEAFLDNPHNYKEVNHKDENKLNNNVNNLEWCDAKYNINFGTCIERRSKKKSKPVLQYTLDGEFVREWESATQAEREGGYQHGHIISVCKGKRPHHKGYIWKYKNPSDD